MKIKALQLPTLVLGNSLVFVVTLGLTTLFSSALESLEVKTLDSRFQFRDFLQLNPSYSNSLVHINLDNYSKQASKVPVWPKTQYARIIDRIARGNAKVIACDVMFVSRADKHGDDELVDAFVTAGNVISPLLLDFSGTGSSFIPSEELALDLNPPIAQGKASLAYGILAAPMPRITEQSSGLGFVNIAPDADGIIRRVKLVADLNGTLVPSFFLQSLAAYLDYDIANIVPVSGSRLILKDFPTDINGTTQDLRVPLDGNGHMVVNLVGRLNTDIYHQSYSAWDLLQAEENPDFSGKLVFVADTSLQSNQSGDFSAVPLEKLFPRSYIFSTAASSILGQRFIRPTGTSVTFALALMLCGLLVLVCARAGTLVFSVTALCVFTLYVAAVFGIFLFGGWVLPLLPVLGPLVAVYLFSNHWQRQQYRVFSFVDDLTGLHNRRWLNDLLPRQVSRASMSGEPLSVGMIDIDHFKSFNDTYGHQAGDFVLAAVAACLVDNLRPTDLSARYGGEEFTIILPQTNIEGAITAAERMCKSVSLLNLVTPNGVNLPTITISIGVSELTANQHMDQLIEIADRALYEAKETGRNRVCKGTTEKVLPETEDN